MIIINIEEKPINSKHISYYTERRFTNNVEHIVLYEVKDYAYIHPQSENMSYISKIDYESVCSFPITSIMAAPLLLLENAMNNIKLNVKNLAAKGE